MNYPANLRERERGREGEGGRQRENGREGEEEREREEGRRIENTPQLNVLF